jgi:hypothetical protein
MALAVTLRKHCDECGIETDCDWCEICSSFVCEACDLAHDCLSEELASDDFEESILDEVDEDVDTEH